MQVFGGCDVSSRDLRVGDENRRKRNTANGVVVSCWHAGLAAGQSLGRWPEAGEDWKEKTRGRLAMSVPQDAVVPALHPSCIPHRPGCRHLPRAWQEALDATPVPCDTRTTYSAIPNRIRPAIRGPAQCAGTNFLSFGSHSSWFSQPRRLALRKCNCASRSSAQNSACPYSPTHPVSCV
jgi:hypothetical protein